MVWSRVLRRVGRISLWLVGGVFLIELVDVVLRYFLLRPLAWSIEACEYLMFAMTFLGTAWLLREGGHIRVEFLDSFLKGRAKRNLELCRSLIGTFTVLVMALVTLHGALEAYVVGVKVVKMYAIPKYPFFLIASFGYWLLTVEYVRQTLLLMKGQVRG